MTLSLLASSWVLDPSLQLLCPQSIIEKKAFLNVSLATKTLEVGVVAE
jgi:hypothetical protein